MMTMMGKYHTTVRARQSRYSRSKGKDPSLFHVSRGLQLVGNFNLLFQRWGILNRYHLSFRMSEDACHAQGHVKQLVSLKEQVDEYDKYRRKPVFRSLDLSTSSSNPSIYSTG